MGFVGTFTTWSATTNNSGAIGVCGEVTHDLVKTDLIVLSANGCANNGKKIYVGDGHNFSASAEAHFYAQHTAAALRPYLIGGIGWSEQVNSQYSKGIVNPFVGAGINYRNRWFIEGNYLLPENGTANHVSALRLRTYYIYPFASHWSLKFGGSVLNMKFTQPNGVAAGTYRATTFTVFGGMLRMNNQKAMVADFPILRHRPRYPDLSGLAQSFLTDFGNYSLMIPAL